MATAIARDFRKVCRIGTIDTGNKRRASVFVKIELREGRLSISGVIGPLASGNALGGCGQIDMGFAHRNPAGNDKRYSKPIRPCDIRFAPGWTDDKWLDLLDVWNRWHMNDMKAGTAAQEEWLRQNPVDATYPKSHYTEASKALTDAGLNPDNGYMYGSKWLSEEIPEETIAFIVSLPDTDKQPAWC
jgi:hypothetical protein